MNPARTLASAAPGMIWQDFWIYLLAPTAGMLASAQLHLVIRGSRASGCAKLLHPEGVRCIHCGHGAAAIHQAMSRTAVASLRSDK